MTTPVCCPSRASILTGKYQHNTQVWNNSVSGNCNSPFWREEQEISTFATSLAESGYVTFYAGKYLNQYGTEHKDTGGLRHVPPGWHFWAGLVGNSRYYNYTLSINGKPEHHGDQYHKDYLTYVVERKAHKFMDFYFHRKRAKTKPFLMVMATPAPHAPFTPAPQYKSAFPDAHVPRTKAFNWGHNENRHWLLRSRPGTLTQAMIDNIDEMYRDRWRTLLSVDDLVHSVMSRLEQEGVLNQTLVVFTSDHGYHLGQLGLPMDKRQPYEFDIRVPMMVRGPGIPVGRESNALVLGIDLAPTFLEAAGHPGHTSLDGKSILGAFRPGSGAFRSDFAVEYHGEGGGHSIDPECRQYYSDMEEVECQAEFDCRCQDVRNNTYTCLRHYSSDANSMTCYFKDDDNFMELYDLNADPYQLNNLAYAWNAPDYSITVKRNSQ